MVPIPIIIKTHSIKGLHIMKQHTRPFQIAAMAASNGNREYAIRYLQGMERSAMSDRALKEIQLEIAKYK
jgi:hypothetical protein